MRKAFFLAPLAAAMVLAAGLSGAAAETRVTLKSAKSTSSYYQMMVQLSEALKAGSKGGLIATVEESQGSVQNVMEAAKRPGNYVFTTPPVLIKLAHEGKGKFKADPAYDEIRSLFPIPYLTMHWVVRADSGINSLSDLAGKDFIPGGKGSFGYRQTVGLLEKLGIADKVNIVDVELNAAVPALKNRKVAGFATAGSYPAPNVMEAAAGTKIKLLGISDEDYEKMGKKGALIDIPAGTYPGVDAPVRTLTLPVGAYTTTRMDDATAYAVTKAFWEQRAEMAKANAWWGGVTGQTVGSLGAKLHPGALKYYMEASMAIPAALK